MNYPTVPVTAVILDENGQPVAGAIVMASLTGDDLYQGETVQGTTSAVTDASGTAVLDLFPNTLGEMGTQYAVTVATPSAVPGTVVAAHYLATVPNTACDLMDIASHAVSGEHHPQLMSHAAAVAAEVAATVADLTQGSGAGVHGLPAGGSAGQVLYKIDGTDYNVGFETLTPSLVGLGNVTNDAQVKRSEMGAADGVATLDASSHVVQDPASKGQADGVASLDATGKVPASQLPASPAAANASAAGLTGYLLPSSWRELYKNGWTPAFFNQQWGGGIFGFEENGVEYESVAAYIGISTFSGPVNAFGMVSYPKIATPFLVGSTQTLSGVFVYLGKVSNPSNNIFIAIQTDASGPSGSPVTNGTSNPISGKTITATGGWVYFTFTTAPSITANTKYWFVLYTDSNDNTNYYHTASGSTSSIPPYGTAMYYDTSWHTMTSAICFKAIASAKMLATGGMFNNKLVFNESSPLNHSRALCNDIKRIYDGQGHLTVRLVAGGLTNAKTFLDLLYGLDHDRIVARVENSAVVVRLYRQDGTVCSVTGTTDVTGAGPFDIMIAARLKGDGSDYLKLYLNGASEGTPLAGQTFAMDPLFHQLGTAWLGGGFGVAPSWTGNMSFAQLPSHASNGWTYSGTATEANAFAVTASGTLRQNKAGFGATDTGSYSRTISAANANGSSFCVGIRPLAMNNAVDNSCSLLMEDGTKTWNIKPKDYYVQWTLDNGATFPSVQPCSPQEWEQFLMSSKGSDAYVFKNYRLLVDGTGKLSGATANNRVVFGDSDSTSGASSDCEYNKIAYLQSAAILPEFTNASLHEIVFWSGDQTTLAASLYNSGTLQSVKAVCGIRENALSIVQPSILDIEGVTLYPTISSSTMTTIPEMFAFVLGEHLDIYLNENHNVLNGCNTFVAVRIDGNTVEQRYAGIAVSTYYETIAMRSSKRVATGLHYINGVWSTNNGATTTGAVSQRNLIVETK